MLGDVAVRHPTTRIGHVEEDVDRLARPDEHCVFPDEVRLLDAISCQNEKPSRTVDVERVRHRMVGVHLVDKADLDLVSNPEYPVDRGVRCAGVAVDEFPAHVLRRRAPIYLEEVVDSSARGVRHIADQKGVTLVLNDLVEAPIHGDADLLGRLLLNLLDNAIKHSPSGGTIRVSLSRQGSDYHVSVADEGPGIPEAAKERVFERFFRADEARVRDESGHTTGAGLGLAISRRIAELHGGTLILVESRPGHTEFRFTVPADKAALEADRVTA